MTELGILRAAYDATRAAARWDAHRAAVNAIWAAAMAAEKAAGDAEKERMAGE